MNIIIFGATGGTGQHLVKQALSLGHHVTAFVRSAQKLTLKNELLNTFEGDVLNYDDVETGIKKHDVVICALGHPNIMDNSGIREKGTLNIVKAMQETNVKRLICQSSLGTGDSYQLLPFMYKAIIAPLFMKRLFKDHAAQEDIIKKSDLEWVIVRPATLKNGEKESNYHYGSTLSDKKLQIKVSRADVAEFILKQIKDSALLYSTPYISD